MKAGGFISLHRQILDWEWFKDATTFHTFVYLLLSANFELGNYKGVEIQRGQLITSLPKISADLQQTIQQTRTALKHLKLTGEITDEGNPQYRIITIVKYDEYQRANRPSNRQLTGNQQTDQQTIQQHNNNINNNNKNNNPPLTRSIIGAKFIPPSIDDVEVYCLSIQMDGFQAHDFAQKFCDYYESRGWILSSGKKMVNWQATIRTWLRRDREKEQKKAAEPEILPY